MMVEQHGLKGSTMLEQHGFQWETNARQVGNRKKSRMKSWWNKSRFLQELRTDQKQCGKKTCYAHDGKFPWKSLRHTLFIIEGSPYFPQECFASPPSRDKKHPWHPLWWHRQDLHLAVQNMRLRQIAPNLHRTTIRVALLMPQLYTNAWAKTCPFTKKCKHPVLAFFIGKKLDTEIVEPGIRAVQSLPMNTHPCANQPGLQQFEFTTRKTFWAPHFPTGVDAKNCSQVMMRMSWTGAGQASHTSILLCA